MVNLWKSEGRQKGLLYNYMTIVCVSGIRTFRKRVPRWGLSGHFARRHWIDFWEVKRETSTGSTVLLERFPWFNFGRSVDYRSFDYDWLVGLVGRFVGLVGRFVFIEGIDIEG